MVSEFQVDLDPDDLQLGPPVMGVAGEEEEQLEEEEEEKEDHTRALSDDYRLRKLSVDSDNNERTNRKSAKSKKKDSMDSDIADVEAFMGVSNISAEDLDSLALQGNNIIGAGGKERRESKSKGGERKEECAEEEVRREHLDDWLNSEEGSAANPYVSTANIMPDGIEHDDSDLEEGQPTLCRL